MSLADLYLAGVFEDAAQRDFVSAWLGRLASARGHDLRLEDRLTAGCRFDNLESHLRDFVGFAGTVVAVDGQKRAGDEKRRLLLDRCAALAAADNLEILVASPSVEAWMLADQQALLAVLADNYGPIAARRVPRPPRSERGAKNALATVCREVLDTDLLLGGREHAAEVGARFRLDELSPSRFADLFDARDRLGRVLDRAAAAT